MTEYIVIIVAVFFLSCVVKTVLCYLEYRELCEQKKLPKKGFGTRGGV
jgi:hypothetical protein